MSYKIMRLSLWSIPILLMSLCPLGLRAQQGGAQAENKPARHMVSVTGCLQQGVEQGGLFITGEDGKVWELHSHTVKLADHLGHKVTVSGSRTREAKAKEEEMGKSEKKEAGDKEYGDLRVTKLKMISASCDK